MYEKKGLRGKDSPSLMRDTFVVSREKVDIRV